MGLAREASGGAGNAGAGLRWRNGTAYAGYADSLPWDDYTAWQQDVLRACWRLLTDDGAIYYVHKPRPQSGQVILPTIYGGSLPLRQVIIWARAGGVNCARTHYMPTHEWICVYAKPGFRLRSKGASSVGDVWRIAQEPNTWHPAPFPQALAERTLDTTGARLVLDPFMGSGTTGRAAARLGRDYIGIERHEPYAARARWEIAALRGQPERDDLRDLPLFAGGGNRRSE